MAFYKSRPRYFAAGRAQTPRYKSYGQRRYSRRASSSYSRFRKPVYSPGARVSRSYRNKKSKTPVAKLDLVSSGLSGVGASSMFAILLGVNVSSIPSPSKDLSLSGLESLL